MSTLSQTAPGVNPGPGEVRADDASFTSPGVRLHDDAPTTREMIEWVQPFVDPGHVVELRALGVRMGGRDFKTTQYGYYDSDHLDDMVRIAAAMTRSSDGIYFTLNPVDPDLLARACNQVKSAEKGKPSSATDGDIVRRKFILFDFDPKRKAGISSTAEEKASTWAKVEMARRYLRSLSWPDPIVADSGNGWHLLYRIDEPADDGGLIKNVLLAMAARFSDDVADVDTSVFNPARITKLYGTLSRKGDSTPSRPHRYSWVMETPPRLEIVSHDLLAALASEAEQTKAVIVPINPIPSPQGGTNLETRFIACLVKTGKPSIETQKGSNGLFNAACMANRFDIAPDRAKALIATHYNVSQFCSPLWTQEDIDRKVDEAYRKHTSERGSMAADRPRKIARTTYARTKPQGAPRVEPRADTDDEWERERPRVIEAPDDPHRLQDVFVGNHFTTDGDEKTLLNHKGDYYRPSPEGTHYELYPDLMPDLVGSMKDEFNRINLDQLRDIKDQVEANGKKFSEIPIKDLPEVMQVTPSKVKAVELALRSETLLPSSLDAPCWVGPSEGMPEPVNLMAARNGLLDVSTRRLYPHTSRYFNPFPAVPYAYDPSAPKPKRLLQFLQEVWPDDQGVWREIQKWIGYLLTPDTRQQKILLLVGPPRSGKGTIGRLLASLLGPHNVANPTLSLLATNFGLSSLVGKTVAIVGDARFGGSAAESAIVVERLLGISGEDSFTIDRKYKESIGVRFRSRLIIFTNEPPNLRETSSALANRFCPFQMKETFLGREDKGLDDALLAERAGILNWALDGRDMLQADGRFLLPESCQGLMNVVKEMTSPTQAFIDDCCETDEAIIRHLTKNSKDLPTRESIFKAYVVWCEETNHRASSDGVFGRNLRTACPKIEDSRPRLPDGSRERRIQGIELNSYGRSLALKYRPPRSGEGY